MRKWWIALLWEVIICVFLAGGYAVYTHHNNQQWKVLETQKKQQEQHMQEQIQKEIAARDEEEKRIRKLKDVILSVGSPMDELFVEWLVLNYEETAQEAADQIEEGIYDHRIWYDATGMSVYVLKDTSLGIMDSDLDMKQQGIYKKNAAGKDFVSLSFAGDVSFANDYAPAQNYTNLGIDGAFSKDLQNTMQDADIFMLNNEFCYTTSANPLPGKTYTFKADPALVKRLDEMGVDLVSIANNHAYDFGEEGFLDTIKTLKEAEVPYVGGGKDLEDAKNNIVYFVINGMKIGYIAATQVERQQPILTQPATENSAGVIRCFEPELVVSMIEEAERNSDFVIVYPHWGTELMKEIQADQQQLAYAFIDAGADAIVGGHPHCLQGVEYYKGIPIFYSLSNFSFSSKAVDSCVLNLEVTIDGIQKARYIPCMESYGTTYQCQEGSAEYNRILELFNTYSKNAQIDQKGYVTEEKQLTKNN